MYFFIVQYEKHFEFSMLQFASLLTPLENSLTSFKSFTGSVGEL